MPLNQTKNQQNRSNKNLQVYFTSFKEFWAQWIISNISEWGQNMAKAHDDLNIFLVLEPFVQMKSIFRCDFFLWKILFFLDCSNEFSFHNFFFFFSSQKTSELVNLKISLEKLSKFSQSKKHKKAQTRDPNFWHQDFFYCVSSSENDMKTCFVDSHSSNGFHKNVSRHDGDVWVRFEEFSRAKKLNVC